MGGQLHFWLYGCQTLGGTRWSCLSSLDLQILGRIDGKADKGCGQQASEDDCADPAHEDNAHELPIHTVVAAFNDTNTKSGSNLAVSSGHGGTQCRASDDGESRGQLDAETWCERKKAAHAPKTMMGAIWWGLEVVKH